MHGKREEKLFPLKLKLYFIYVYSLLRCTYVRSVVVLDFQREIETRGSVHVLAFAELFGHSWY
jgi:hypothetical protein